MSDKTETQEECPICQEMLHNNNDISITKCNHKFHTSCLIQCNRVCPLCRTNMTSNLASNTQTTQIPPGTYSYEEYVEQLNRRNIPLDSLATHVREWLEECEEDIEREQRYQTISQTRKQIQKENMKRYQPEKYNLFYGKK